MVLQKLVIDSCTKKNYILKYPATVPGKELDITNFHSQWGTMWKVMK
jgi:hypothetical protein